MQNRKRDTDVQNRLLDSVGEGEGGMFWENSNETCILSRVKQITSPGWMHETSAQGWCRGMGWGGRWEGGSGWGTHVNPWLIHVNVWQKPLQYYKVISLQLIKINGNNNNNNNNKSVLSTTGLIQGEVLTFWGNILLVISEVFYCYIPPCTPLLSHFCILLRGS